MVVTEEFLEKGRSVRGAWSYKQLRLLGLDTNNLRHGWQKTIVGREIPDGDAAKFLELKDAHLKNREKYRDLFAPEKRLEFAALKKEDQMKYNSYINGLVEGYIYSAEKSVAGVGTVIEMCQKCVAYALSEKGGR